MVNRWSVVICGIILIFFSACGEYKCDSKEYAESALNLTLFGKVEGNMEHKEWNIKNLGFHLGDVAMLKLDKDNKQSICKVNITNSFVDNVTKNHESKDNDSLIQNMTQAEKDRISVFLSASRYNSQLAMVMNDIYKSLKLDTKEAVPNPQDLSIIMAYALVAFKLHNDGMTYITYDNGNGDVMIKVND